MKKILCLISIFIMFLTLPVFAEYKPIPKELSKQYKAEIEQIINEKYPKVLKDQREIYNKAINMYKKVLKNNDLYEEFCLNNYDMATDTPEFYLYVDLMNITQKYANFKEDDIPATDNAGTLYHFLSPYFKANNIDIKKLTKLSDKSNYYRLKIENLYEKTPNVVNSKE